jgi:hypothetical protein
VLIGVGVAGAVFAAFLAGQHRRDEPGDPPAAGGPPLPPQPPAGS